MFLDFLYNINLTRDQKNAANQLDKFLYNTDDFLIIQGSAGTGKTFLISKFAGYLKRKNKNFIFLAPTGRAANIISQKSSFNAKTIHSEIYDFIYEKVSVENNEFKVFFEIKNYQIKDTIFIIDESSMISDIDIFNEKLVFGSGKLLSDLITYVFRIGYNNKIIFLGDENQLPPIGSKISPALDKYYIENNFDLKGDKIYLEDIIRQKEDSYILKNANKLKEKIKAKDFLEIKFDYSDDFIEKTNFLEIYDYFNPAKDIIICSTNKIALEYNKKIRKNYGYKEILEVGDILINTKNSKYFNKPIFNGEFFKVKEIYNHIKDFVYIKNEKAIPVEFHDVILENIENKENIDCRIFSNSLFSEKTDIDDLSYQALYVYTIKEIKENFDIYFEEELLEKIKGNRTFNSLHVKYGYAVTAHKAQGGEWNNVFIDAKYYGNYKSKEYFKWLYTSITRAKKNVFIKNIPIKSTIFEKVEVNYNFNIKNNINISYNLIFPDSNLKKIYNQFLNIVSRKDFQIIGNQHFQYQEVYFLKKDNDYLKVQIYYNKNFKVAKIKVMESTSAEKTQEFLSLFSKNQIKAERKIKDNKDNNGCIKAYVDGSYDNTLKRYGAGIVIIKKDNNIEKYYTYGEKYLKYRNVAGEIIATLLSFEYAKNENIKCLEIYYDYSGIANWALGLWKTNTELTKFYKEKFEYYKKYIDINFKKVQAHSGDKFNNLADELAKKAVFEKKKFIKYDISF
ncbi:AAA family ATPase [Marinitoga sp. 1154]|uniref:AAA family ATPase n=1 Tax=Marinitoga sp. 1154 TaxID=1643335 RepID=UPI001586A061|nr:AAA family ATPase [Marinitoga sp. 1154]